MGLVLLFGTIIILGAILGWIAFFQLGSIRRESEELRNSLKKLEALVSDMDRRLLRAKIPAAPGQESSAAASDSASAPVSATAPESPVEPGMAHSPEPTPEPTPEPAPESTPEPELAPPVTHAVAAMQAEATAASSASVRTSAPVELAEEPGSTDAPAPETSSPWIATLKRREESSGNPADATGTPETAAVSAEPGSTAMFQNWMVWIGGLCVALSGIFLVRYSMDAGLLGPRMRVTLGFIAGFAMHGVAEVMRRRNSRHFASLAALAGGASAFLYAALLAALHLYDLLSPGMAFALLAVVALLTMVLALLHGPILAVMGMLGAYSVPILVGSDGGSIEQVLIYAAIITAACLLLMTRVYRNWLWFGMVVGALSWWFIARTMGDMTLWQHLYLLVFTLVCVLLCEKQVIAVLPAPEMAAKPGDEPAPHTVVPLSETLSLILVTWFFTVVSGAGTLPEGLYPVLLIGVFVYAARLLPVLQQQVLAQLLALPLFWLASSRSFSTNLPDQVLGIETILYAVLMSVVFMAVAREFLRRPGTYTWWVDVLVVTPLLWFLTTRLATSELEWSAQWGIAEAGVALAYAACGLWLLNRGDKTFHILTAQSVSRAAYWMVILALSLYVLAAADLLDGTAFSMALAAELVLISFLYVRMPCVPFEYALKGAFALVISNVMASPLLLEYDASEHWTIFGVHVPALFAAAALYVMGRSPQPEALTLRRWMELAFLHLLVLSVWSEVRFWLYDGDVFRQDLTLAEMALNVSMWLSLALVYRLRAGQSQSLATYYHLMSWLLLSLGTLCYLAVLVPLNPMFNGETTVSTLPFFNLLLLAYGVPPLLMLALYRYHDPRLRLGLRWAIPAAAFVFLNMEIRHLWEPGLLLSLGISEGELYTYSAAWLTIAVATMLLGGLRFGDGVYKAGGALLLVVIAKVFLVDTSGLEGLWRVMSYLLLGLSLLGLAYLHQRLNLLMGRNRKG